MDHARQIRPFDRDAFLRQFCPARDHPLRDPLLSGETFRKTIRIVCADHRPVDPAADAVRDREHPLFRPPGEVVSGRQKILRCKLIPLQNCPGNHREIEQLPIGETESAPDRNRGINFVPSPSAIATFEPSFRFSEGLDIVFADIHGNHESVSEIIRSGELIRPPELLFRPDSPDHHLFLPQRQLPHSNLPVV